MGFPAGAGSTRPPRATGTVGWVGGSAVLPHAAHCIHLVNSLHEGPSFPRRLRLNEDRPDMYELVVRGELSPHAGMVDSTRVPLAVVDVVSLVWV